MSSIIACPCLGPLARLASTSIGGSEIVPGVLSLSSALLRFAYYA